jgi:hypothetical protein
MQCVVTFIFIIKIEFFFSLFQFGLKWCTSKQIEIAGGSPGI